MNRSAWGLPSISACVWTWNLMESMKLSLWLVGRSSQRDPWHDVVGTAWMWEQETRSDSFLHPVTLSPFNLREEPQGLDDGFNGQCGYINPLQAGFINLLWLTQGTGTCSHAIRREIWLPNLYGMRLDAALPHSNITPTWRPKSVQISLHFDFHCHPGPAIRHGGIRSYVGHLCIFRNFSE